MSACVLLRCSPVLDSSRNSPAGIVEDVSHCPGVNASNVPPVVCFDLTASAGRAGVACAEMPLHLRPPSRAVVVMPQAACGAVQQHQQAAVTEPCLKCALTRCGSSGQQQSGGASQAGRQVRLRGPARGSGG